MLFMPQPHLAVHGHHGTDSFNTCTSVPKFFEPSMGCALANGAAFITKCNCWQYHLSMEKKQIYGPVIPFVGLDVDLNKMVVSVSDEHCADLITKVLDFAKPGKCHPLQDFELLTGHLNWSFAVFPLLKPSLSAIYQKISSKSLSLTPICINMAIVCKLNWFTKHAHASNSIFLLNTITWDPTL